MHLHQAILKATHAPEKNKLNKKPPTTQPQHKNVTSRQIPATLWQTSPGCIKCKGRKLGKHSGIASFQTSPASALVKEGGYKSYLPSFWKHQSRKLSRKHRRMFLLITCFSTAHSLPEAISHVTERAGNKTRWQRFIGHLSTPGSHSSLQGWDYIMPELFKGWGAKTALGAASTTPQVPLQVRGVLQIHRDRLHPSQPQPKGSRSRMC